MEGAAAATAQETKTPGKIVSAGQPTKATFTAADIAEAPAEGEGTQGDDTKLKDGAAVITDPPAKTEGEKNDPPAAGDKPLTEADILKFLKDQNIDVENLQAIKDKLAKPAATKTPEEIKAEENKIEQRMIEAHLKRNGTVEEYAQFKNLATADPKLLGLTKIQQELIAEGFDKDQADAITRKMHFQYTEEELEDLKPEQLEQLKKESAYGLKKQESRGKYIQTTAKSYLDKLRNEVLEQDAELALSAQHTSKVEDAIKKVVRDQKITLGEYNGQTLDPVDLKIPDEVLTQVKDILSDPAKLEKTLYNADGTYNLDFLVPHLIASVSRETLAKHALLEGQNRQVEIFKATFGEVQPKLTGINKEKGVKGKIVGVGKPELMPRQTQNQ